MYNSSQRTPEDKNVHCRISWTVGRHCPRVGMAHHSGGYTISTQPGGLGIVVRVLQLLFQNPREPVENTLLGDSSFL